MDLQIIVYQDDVGYIAQGVEIDHASQGDTWGEAVKNFHESMGLTMEGITGPVPPSLFWDAREHSDDYLRLLEKARGPSLVIEDRCSWPQLPFSGVKYLVMHPLKTLAEEAYP